MKFNPINLILLPLPLFLFSCDEGDYSSSNRWIGDAMAYEENTYNEIVENPFVKTSEEPTSTFSVDADGASYANTRRHLEQLGSLPPSDAIRTEEFLNYFMLDYPYENAGHPISINGEVSTCPWEPEHNLVRIGIKGEPLSEENKKGNNYVFLIDVSGSMSSTDKLGMLKTGFTRLVDQLSGTDYVSIVTYAGSAGVLLKPTSGDEKRKIKNAIDQLGAGGSTAGAAGILTAYELAEENMVQFGNNRIIIGTDGDFNVGPSSQEELIKLIEEKRESGIYITVLGVGYGNLQDGMLEQIANKGNGTYEYIDKAEQLEKVFVYERDKFFSVAKDVKVQVTFNPEVIAQYRLIGYENRMLNNGDFENDSTDAGEIGANQNITALYQVVPTQEASGDAFSLNFRYKARDSDASTELIFDLPYAPVDFASASDYQIFSAAVAAFALTLRESSYKGSASYSKVLEWLDIAKLSDEHGFKSELKELVDRAASLTK